MTKITVLGLGAMGSRMARNLLKAGHEVCVWNRTQEAAAPLVAAGAALAPTPRAAAQGAEVVLAMLRDDEASRAVWLDPHNGARVSMAPGTIALESSTLSPGWVRRLGAALQAQGVALADVPVSGSLPQAEAGQLVFLAGGEPSIVTRITPLLRAMGSSIHHVGPLGAGSLVKLATNALLGIQVTALAELIGLLETAGVEPDRALAAMSGTAVWSPVATSAAGSMRARNFAPLFPVALIEKDFGYALQAAGSTAAAPTLAAARNVFRRAIDAGLGNLNMTAVAELYRADGLPGHPHTVTTARAC